MLKLKTPRGLLVDVPETASEDLSPRFPPTEFASIRNYYLENGYVIVKSLIGRDVCDLMRSLWDSEVKPYKGAIYRQATAKAERHVQNDNGWIMNPILNLQSVDPVRFPNFRRTATSAVLTDKVLSDVFAALLGDRPKIVQSMYFEGNSATWEHQDSYYLDSERPGEMAAAWIALEDIAARAGRFFICPRSHLLKLDGRKIYENIADNHEAYITSVVDKIRATSLEIRAPKLEQGDVLFWNAWTIHGSLDTQDPNHSRSSITCHAIPASSKFLQLQMRVMDLDTDEVNGVLVHRPKDLAVLRHRLMLFIESHFSVAFYAAKAEAIKMLRRKQRLKAQLSGPRSQVDSAPPQG